MRRFLNRLLGRGMTEKDIHSGQTAAVSNQSNAEHLILEGNELEDAGDLEQAEQRYRTALQTYPDFPKAYLNLGNIQVAQGHSEDAISSYREALRLEPGYGAAHANLGKLYLSQENYQNATAHYTIATHALPESAEAWVGLGSALEEIERKSEAIEAYQRALNIQPDFAGAKLNLGRSLMALKRLDEAAEQLENLLLSIPDHVLGHVWLGKVLGDMGFCSQSVSLLRQALQLDPKNPNIIDLMLLNMNNLPDCSSEKLFAAHLSYGQCFNIGSNPISQIYQSAEGLKKQLKIGYVSADFRNHPVARFIEPVFTYHNRTQFEVHGFYNYHSSDNTTKHLRKLVDAWHPIWGIDDKEVANQIRALDIDILIDLSGHTGHHRLPMFAQKPAPVQATWLGYLGTTGLTSMDYRICDIYTDPPGLTESLHTEQLARLPSCQWCYIPHPDLPQLTKVPLQRNGYLTLGSLNGVGKVNDRVLLLWAEILNALPTAKLRIAGTAHGRTRQRFISILGAAGVTQERLEFLPHLPYLEYLSAISEVDIALDPFPYNGGTTSFDTLIMGVPLVTLVGERSIARGGFSILTNLGLLDLIATTPTEYIKIVCRLASDPDRLVDLRRTLRDKLRHSSLMDGQQFTLCLETLYQEMWQALRNCKQ